MLKKFPNGILVTGGPLGNLHQFLLHHPDLVFESVFIQGGFAGSDCVPPENQLDKFKGKRTCPTFNFNGHIKGAHAMLSSPNIKKRHLISKDVCHSVYWSEYLQYLAQKFRSDSGPCWAMTIDAMGRYLQKKPDGKLLHDPLAACTAINPEIIKFCEVKCFVERGEWGSTPAQGSNTFISVGVNIDLFYSVFLDVPMPVLQKELIPYQEELSKMCQASVQAGPQKKGKQTKKARVQNSGWAESKNKPAGQPKKPTDQDDEAEGDF